MAEKVKFVYRVRCTEPVMNEMARYEGSKVVRKMDPQCDEHWKSTDLQEAYTTHLYIVEGIPNQRRWLSFGICVERASVI